MIAERAHPVLVLLAGLALVHCSSATTAPIADAAPDANACFPDNDGINGGVSTIELVVTDTGFFASGADAGPKEILATENEAQVTFTLTNRGTRPHGFKVGCVSVVSSYPNLPAGCPTSSCFPARSIIAPLAPGASPTVTFDSPPPDNLIYPFTTNEPADNDDPALNDGQWSLM